MLMYNPGTDPASRDMTSNILTDGISMSVLELCSLTEQMRVPCWSVLLSCQPRVTVT